MKIKKIIAGMICASMILTNITYVSAEEPSNVYVGIDNAQEIINNIDFKDVSSLGADYWAKNAIYRMAGLSIIQGYGEKNFKPSNLTTRAEVLALIYRSLGKESDAQKEGQVLEEQRTSDEKKKSARAIWADGYFSLAQKDGLITTDQFNQATGGGSYLPGWDENFDPNSPAQRQEVAVWIAKAFGIEPIYSQTLVFNSYKDWQQIDQDKIPYVEALLKNKIMNGDNGSFYPKRALRRDEMSQILTNIEDKIYEKNSLGKQFGYIENISAQYDNQPGKVITIRTIYIRGNDGKLSAVVLSSEQSQTSPGNEIGAHPALNSEKEVVVNKDGVLGKSGLLKKDDEVLLIYDNDKKAKYIEAKSQDAKEFQYYGTVEGIDTANNKITFTDVYGITRTFSVSEGVTITINGEAKSLGEIPYGANAYITKKHDLITWIDISGIRKNNYFIDAFNLDARGVVEEINPELNYMCLYGVNGKKAEQFIRTFNFSPNVDVNKNHIKASVSDIEVGDTVYIKFDENYNIELINVETNYITLCGQVLNIGSNYLIVKSEDGTIQRLDFDEDMLIFKYGEILDPSGICVGDNVKLTLNQNDQFSKIKVVSIEGDQHYITSIYKGKVYDLNQDELMLFNVKELNKDNWLLIEQRGFYKVLLDENAKLYSDGVQISVNDAKDIYYGKDVYVACFKDYGQDEKAVVISSVEGYEKTYNDKVLTNSVAGKNIGFYANMDNIIYSQGTIVVKYGRLTTGNNIKVDDPIYAVALRDAATNDISASIIQVSDKPSITGIDIYRGKISSIQEGESFAVESFSVLKGNDWVFTNTPKTFDISYQTKIVDEQGIVNNRDFIDYSDVNYKDKIVYVVTKDSETQLISNAIYGIVNLRGEIYKIENSNLTLKDSVVLSVDDNSWDNLGDSVISIKENTIIIKNSSLVEPEQLEIGDKIRVIKKDDTASGDGLIILVEE